MEDGWVLAQALGLVHSRGSENLVRDALQIFEEIRLPYYQRMYVPTGLALSNPDAQKLTFCAPYRYRYLDGQRAKVKQAEQEDKTINEILEVRFKSFGVGQEENMDWIYKHDIGKVWSDYLKGIKEVHG